MGALPMSCGWCGFFTANAMSDSFCDGKKTPGNRLLPAVLFAEFGDVGYVVATVPGVEGGHFFEGDFAERGVGQVALPVGFGHCFHDGYPALVEAVEEAEGGLCGDDVCVLEFGPGGFVVGLDGGFVLCQRELEADVAVHVAVGEVVDDLAYRPTAFAIGGVELVLG